MKHRAGAAGVLLAALLQGGAWAAPDFTLGVSEGTSGGLDHAQVIAKYQGLANAIGQSLGNKVNVVFVREFKALEDGMKNGRFDFMMARPSDYPARGLRDYGYRYVASAKPEGQCHVVVPKDSPLKALADLKGKRFVMPEQISYMSRFCQAELRDQGVRGSEAEQGCIRGETLAQPHAECADHAIGRRLDDLERAATAERALRIKRGLRIVSGRTESHLMLVDLRAKGITGKEAEAVLGQAHITVNKNAIPNDPEKPFVTSGIRVGTPAMTTRGFKEAEAELTGNLIADVLDNPRDEANIAAVRARVNELTARLPVYRG